MVFEKINNVEVYEQDYQCKLTQMVINSKNELQKKYDQINKKLAQGIYLTFII